MARTQTQIKAEITTGFMSNAYMAVLYNFALNSSFEANFSPVSVESIVFELVSFSIFVLEQLFDKLKAEIVALIYNQKSGRLSWYKTMALAFQYGFSLVPDHDYYDNSGYTAQQIAASKVIKYAAVGESDTESRVIIKIAGEISGTLAPLTTEQKAAFDAYMKEVKWPRKLTIINYLPDRLYLNLKIQYDGQVLDNNGMSILTANYPVDDALSEYMKELPFNGELRLSALIDKLQMTEGVKDATLMLAESSWIDPVSNDYGDPVAIDIAIIPQSGYFTIENTIIEYYT